MSQKGFQENISGTLFALLLFYQTIKNIKHLLVFLDNKPAGVGACATCQQALYLVLCFLVQMFGRRYFEELIVELIVTLII